MGAEQAGGLDDLMMGNVAEGSEETSEQIAARIAASQARLAAVKKDEGVATAHDGELARVVRTLPIGILRFVGWLIDKEVPSFTILAILAISNARAEELMKPTWEIANIDSLNFLSEVHNKHIRTKISVWCQAIILVDRSSKVGRLNSLKKVAIDHAQFAGGLRAVLENYLLRADAEFDPDALDRLARDTAGWVCVK